MNKALEDSKADRQVRVSIPPPLKMSPMKEYIFTFCCGEDKPYRNCYTVISAPTSLEARKEMIRRYGKEWAFQYRTREEAGVYTYNLKEIK